MNIYHQITEMKKKYILTESQLKKLITKSLISEGIRNLSFGGVMKLQEYILDHELRTGIAKVSENDPQGCNSTTYNDGSYKQGQKNQCKITGTLLCNGPCFQKQAIDGVMGPKTKAAYEKYKKDIKFNDEKSLEYYYETTSSEEGNLELSKARQQNWQIPAEMDNIKAFQYWVWKSKEKDSERKPGTQEWKSILCGNNFCTVQRAVDGYWGTNTKNTWKQYGDEYLKTYRVDTSYQDMYDILNS